MLSIWAWRFNHTSTDFGKLVNNKPCSQVYRAQFTLIRQEVCLILDNFEKSYGTSARRAPPP